MRKKETFYEMLEIAAGASTENVIAAHRRKVEALKAEEAKLGHEDYDFRLKLLNLALETLSDPMSRRRYDEKIAAQASSGDSARDRLLPSSPLPADLLSRRADVLSLRADALALRADALSMKTDADQSLRDEPASLISRLLGGLASSFGRILVGLGTFAVIALLVQFGFVSMVVRKNESAAAAAAKAEEQIIIQEYYQKYGVRPANATEARLLEQEQMRRENEARAEERKKQLEEEKARRFDEEARRLGDKVSAELRYAEEKARQEEEYKKAQKEAEEKRRIEAENERIEREKDRWRQVLSR